MAVVVLHLASGQDDDYADSTDDGTESLDSSSDAGVSMPMDDTSGTSMGAPGPGAMPMASASPPSASIATAPVVSAPTAPVIAAASAPTTEEDISLQSLGAQADEQGVLEILSENGTDPITVRNLEPGN